MLLASGTRLGPYEIQSALGAGGMGQVYRARDTRLDRVVAIKILPVADIDLQKRFAREARMIASLTHPYICTIYDVGHHEGTDYLVMECLDGETLASRLTRGRVPLPEAIAYATSIAEALDAAHRAGVIHRDVKPANIMLSSSGAKLLDFGIAKLRPVPSLTDVSATQSAAALTVEGTIVGTPQYMAPELLEGREGDARSDLFAFGAVLYEMVTGQKAFDGRSPASMIAAVMSSEPSMVELRKISPPALEHLVTTCLNKDPDRRRQTAHDLALDLRWIARGGDAPAIAHRSSRARWPSLSAAALALIALGAAGAVYSRRPEPALVPTRASILAPEESRFVGLDALSPDGSRLAFAARGTAGKTNLWIRSLGSSSAVQIAGADEAVDPFWSPDGRSIAFFAKGKLKVASTEAGPSPPIHAIADVLDPRGGTWNRDGVIVFTRNLEDGLYSVPSTGGDVKALTTLDRNRRENSHRWPQFLPDGRHVLFLVRSAATENQGIYVMPLGGGEKSLVLRTPSSALVASFDGATSLFYMRDQTIVAQPFDLRTRSLRGSPTPIAESVGLITNRGVFSIADNGSMTYRSVTGTSERAAWFDDKGTRLGPGPEHSYQIRISPDGKRLAFGRPDQQIAGGDIWLQDLERGVITRFTSDRAYDWIPIWSPTGNSLVFASNREGVMDLYEKPSSGSEPERPIYKSAQRKTPTQWSEDGQFVLFDQQDASGRWDVWALPMTAERTPFPLVQSEFDELGGALSPDGKWLAYASDETGDYQVYVQRFGGRPQKDVTERVVSDKTRVSTNGGNYPCWIDNGRRLLYLGLDRKLMSVTVPPGEKFSPASPIPLFQTSMSSTGSNGRLYDVTPDGTRIVMTILPDERAEAPVTLLLNWPAVMKK